MGLHDDSNRTKRDEFHRRLKELMGEYPEMFESPEDAEHCEHYDPSSPKVITGLVLVYSTQNLDRFEEIFWTDPAEQVHWLGIGLLKSAAALMD